MLAIIIGVDHDDTLCSMCGAMIVNSNKDYHSLVFSDGSVSDEFEWHTRDITDWGNLKNHIIVPVEALDSIRME